ncbi:MAG: FAD-dependent monooxygenase [Chitinophagaceae bacterium]|nr:FAD-dependent monooxygenase [Chitinophagaceae bacterium]
MSKKITILGAGLVGSLLAILLQKRGYQVTVLERRPDMRKLTYSAGKSINLAMSMRGWAGLELAGLRKEIEEIAIPMYGRQIHPISGEPVFQAYGKHEEAIYSVSRGELNRKLMTLAEACGVDIRFEQRVTDVDLPTNTISIEDGDKTLSHSDHDVVMAADGAFSALRNAYLRRDRFSYSQLYIEHGYKELCIPAGPNGEFLLDKQALHIWPRRNFMLIALPNTDATFTCTLFLPFEGEHSFENLKTPEAAKSFFETQFPDALALMPTFLEDFFGNPTSSLVIVKCFPWVYQDKNMLIGDAAHAIVPFYGQGMNCGFEDCNVLMSILDNNPDADWTGILAQYQEARKRNGDAVADLAMLNFVEMRDKVADPEFLRRKQIEKELGLLYPAFFNSVYEMVSFSHTSYHVALHCQKAQDELLGKILAAGDFSANLLREDFKKDLDAWMQAYGEKVKEVA